MCGFLYLKFDKVAVEDQEGKPEVNLKGGKARWGHAPQTRNTFGVLSVDRNLRLLRPSQWGRGHVPSLVTEGHAALRSEG